MPALWNDYRQERRGPAGDLLVPALPARPVWPSGATLSGRPRRVRAEVAA